MVVLGSALVAWNWVYPWPTTLTSGGPFWINPTPGAPTAPPRITLAHGSGLEAVIVTNSNALPVASNFGGNLTQGSNVITGVTVPAWLSVGQPIQEQVPPYRLPPNGATVVTAINAGASTVTVSQPASATVNADTLQVWDFYPIGTLDVTVTPSTGVSIADYNFDASNPPDPDHNSGGAGSFTVSAAYVSADGLYPNASAPSLSVTAT